MTQETDTNDSKKSEDSKKVKNEPKTKVVVRRLPPTLTSESFLDSVEPLPPYTFYYYVIGEENTVTPVFSRAYLNFVDLKDVWIFQEKFDGYVFMDNKGNEFPAVVEYAPYSKIPKNVEKKTDPRINTIENDTDYLKFLNQLNNPENEPIAAPETIIEEIQLKEKELKANKGVSNVRTPLVDYLFKRREEIELAFKRARDERRKREIEKQKLRDERREERRDKKEETRDKPRDERDKQHESRDESHEKPHRDIKAESHDESNDKHYRDKYAKSSDKKDSREKVYYKKDTYDKPSHGKKGEDSKSRLHKYVTQTTNPEKDKSQKSSEMFMPSVTKGQDSKSFSTDTNTTKRQEFKTSFTDPIANELNQSGQQQQNDHRENDTQSKKANRESKECRKEHKDWGGDTTEGGRIWKKKCKKSEKERGDTCKTLSLENLEGGKNRGDEEAATAHSEDKKSRSIYDQRRNSADVPVARNSNQGTSSSESVDRSLTRASKAEKCKDNKYYMADTKDNSANGCKENKSEADDRNRDEAEIARKNTIKNKDRPERAIYVPSHRRK